jgi:hypothetical protein
VPRPVRPIAPAPAKNHRTTHRVVVTKRRSGLSQAPRPVPPVAPNKARTTTRSSRPTVVRRPHRTQ